MKLRSVTLCSETLRSVTRVLSGGLGDGAPHGYPARQERVDYVNDNPPALTQD